MDAVTGEQQQWFWLGHLRQSTALVCSLISKETFPILSESAPLNDPSLFLEETPETNKKSPTLLICGYLPLGFALFESVFDVVFIFLFYLLFRFFNTETSSPLW